jgi:protein required for attachment to host cells
MPTQKALWVFCADGGKGTLWQCTTTSHGSCHVEKIDTIENELIGHEHHRPSPLAGKNGKSHAAAGHEKEEMFLRFVRKAHTWLCQRLDEHRIGSVTVFAAPQFLGAWRKIKSNGLSGKIDLHEADLTNLDSGALAKHPAIQSRMNVGATA